MAYELRDYAGGAEATTLAADITSSSLSITIASSTGWPSGGANGPFHIVINRGESTEEKIEVESRTGTTLTVASTSERGVDGTTAAAHTTGATVEHCHTAQDAQEANSHIADTSRDDHSQYLDTTRHDTTTRHTIGTVVPAGTPGTIQPDDAAASGAANSVARSDHTHAITCAAAGTIEPDDVADEGVATSFARSDHTHAIATAAPGSIVPDDTADEGVATSFARSDHTHTISCFTPVALDAASTNTEGVSGGFARSDHVHSMENLPWGVVGTPYEGTADSANYTTSTNSDMATTFTADTTRRYRVNFHSPWSLSASGRWLITVTDGSGPFHRIGDISYDSEGASDVLDSTFLWEPATGGATTLTVAVSEISGSSTLKWVASTGFPRQLWVEDVGPR